MAHDERELQRLRDVYAARAERLAVNNPYDPILPITLFFVHHVQRAMAAAFRRHGIASLNGKRVLEVGCGEGGVLLQMTQLGVRRSDAHGVDILFERLARGRVRLGDFPIAQGNGASLPYRDGTFDLVLQFTAFSSILDESLRRRMAAEMLRVLSPGGLIFWYDFWLNPTNPETVGLGRRDVRSLFPGCSFDFRRVTLAPPIARRLVPISWGLAALLERLGLFNSHYFVSIRKRR